MTPTPSATSPLTLLESQSILRSTPSWEQVQAARKRLEALRKDPPEPFPTMVQDRDIVLGYGQMLQRCAEMIVQSICLGTHLGRLSPAATTQGKLEDGLRALSTGLGLRGRDENDTKDEINRCMRAALPQVKLEAPQGAPNTTGDTWGPMLTRALEQVQELPPLESGAVQHAAWDAWQTRLLAFITGMTDVPVDVAYLACLAEGSLPGTILSAQVKNATVRELSRALAAARVAKSSAPLWFVFGMLAALGFDMGSELTGMALAISNPRGAEAQQFLNRAIQSRMTPKKGLVVVRLAADSLTDAWRPVASVPTIVLTCEEALAQDRSDPVLGYLATRLHGVLIEVGLNEDVRAALSRAKADQIRSAMSGVRFGLLLPANLANTAVSEGYSAVALPRDQVAAAQAFQATGSAGA